MKSKVKTFIDVLKATGAIASLLLACLNEYDKMKAKMDEEKKKIEDVAKEVNV